MIQRDNHPNLVQAFEAGNTGDYYVSVAGHGVSGYTLTVKPAGMDDYAANASTTGFLAPDKPVHGAMHVFGDVDWIKVHLDAGQTYAFELQGAHSGGGTMETVTTEMTLRRPDGGWIANAEGSGGVDPRMIYTADASGDYYLDIHGQAGNNLLGTYTLIEVQTSQDKASPILSSSSMAANAVNVSLRPPKIVLNFNEIVVPDHGITLTDSNGVKVPTYGITQLSAAGSVVTFDTQSYLKPGMTYTLNLTNGGVHDLAGNAASLLNISFTTVKPVATGTAGDDYLIGSGNGLALDGGAGIDTVWFSGPSYTYQIQRNADGSVLVKDTAAANARADTLTGIEHLVFADQAYSVDIDGIDGQAYRMYKGAFNRAPDAEGLGFWINQMEKGMDLKGVANYFITSPEFAKTYGSNNTDADFVTLLYKNVLGRSPDMDGQSFWLGHIANGLSRPDVLAYFSESPENYSTVAKIIGNGFAYTPHS